jgi:2'-5' RNA ligase
MNLTEAYRELITENHKREFGCIMVALPINKESWAELLNKIDPKDVYGKDGDYGKELDPHVTLKFGLHHDIPDELIEEIISKLSPPNVTMANITSFKNEEYDVLKFDIDSPDLHGHNKIVSQLPNSDEFKEYRPHATIAYLNKGAADKYHGKLAKPFVVTPSQIKYSKVDGTNKLYNLS